MKLRTRARLVLRAQPDELIPLVERMTHLLMVRAALACAVLGFTLLTRRPIDASTRGVLAATIGYLLLSGIAEALRRARRGAGLTLIGTSLLIDGLYIAWVIAVTGGADGPLRFLAYLHVVAVTLLASYRTGVKITAWHTLLLFVGFYAQAAGILGTSEAAASHLGDARSSATLIPPVLALWAIALATATFASLNERELRRQKFDLQQLSSMVSEVDQTDDPSRIPRILLDKVCSVFGFPRGVVLASHEGPPAVLASKGAPEPQKTEPGMDRVVESAWTKRETQAVATFDPEADPRLGALLPDARNVLVVPLFLRGGERLGVLVVEQGGRGNRIRRWVVTVLEQFASHAALALHNAWLLEEIRERLDEIRELQIQLTSENLTLETMVARRTEELRDSLSKLREIDQQRRRLLARLVQTVEEERRRIARDIHDDPIQRMWGIAVGLEALGRQLSNPRQSGLVGELLHAVRDSISSLRHLIFELRPPSLDERGLAEALRQYAERGGGDATIEVESRLSRDPSPEARIVLFRIAQEALSNARKHAQASRVKVLLEERSGGFRVEVRDNGVGFDPAREHRPRPGHLGLAAMRERAELAGGWFRVHSLPQTGTRVEFWVPARPPTAQAGRQTDSSPARVDRPASARTGAN